MWDFTPFFQVKQGLLSRKFNSFFCPCFILNSWYHTFFWMSTLFWSFLFFCFLCCFCLVCAYYTTIFFCCQHFFEIFFDIFKKFFYPILSNIRSIILFSNNPVFKIRTHVPYGKIGKYRGSMVWGCQKLKRQPGNVAEPIADLSTDFLQNFTLSISSKTPTKSSKILFLFK